MVLVDVSVSCLVFCLPSATVLPFVALDDTRASAVCSSSVLVHLCLETNEVVAVLPLVLRLVC